MEFESSSYIFFAYTLFIPAYAKQLLFATLCGLVFGLERAFRRKIASLRTFAVICVGSCLFTIVSVEAATAATPGFQFDVTRIAAQVVTGIGFVGGGVIFKNRGSVAGVTTASMLWMAAAVGMAIGFNKIELGAWAVVTYLIILSSSHLLHDVVVVVRLAEAKRRKRQRQAEAAQS